MAKLTIIVGIGGSGKTSLCKEIANQSPTPTYVFPDATLVQNNDERRAGHGALGEMVARLLGRGEDCLMDESHLVHPGFRNSFKRFCDTLLVGVDQNWIFFEADGLACINNVYYDYTFGNRKRDHLSRFRAVDDQRQKYTVPDETDFPGRIVHKVYQGEAPRFKASEESQAIKWLQSEIHKLQSM